VPQTVKTTGRFNRLNQLRGLIEAATCRKMKELLEAMSVPEVGDIQF
jgi:hypothetical protein